MTVRVIALSGFLGAGKTTMLMALAKKLEGEREKVALITNDQGDQLVDTSSVQWAATRTEEVTGGCYCCRFDDLAGVITALVEAEQVTSIVMEAVGSCTDLQSTVVRPLRRFYADSLQVAPMITVLDPERYLELREEMDAEDGSDLAYLFEKQLAEADIIALNKTDVLNPDQAKALTDELAGRYPDAEVIPVSALQGGGLGALTARFGERPDERDVEIDYDRYAAAKAALAWYDQQIDVNARDAELGFMASTWIIAFLDAIAEECQKADSEIGHVKVRLESSAGGVTANLVGRQSPSLATTITGRPGSATVLINARVETEPEAMDEMVVKAVASANETAKASSEINAGPIAFKPGYPVPVHRIPAGESAPITDHYSK